MNLARPDANTLKPIQVSTLPSGIVTQILKNAPLNSSMFSPNGPLGQIGPIKNFSLGATRIPVSPGIDFLPLVSPADEIVSSLQEAVEAPSVRSVAEAVGPLADMLGEAPGVGRTAGIGLEILGAISTAPRAIKALKGQDKIEISFALADLISQSAICIADCAGWTHAKTAAQGMSWVVKVGDQLVLMSHKQACAIKAGGPDYSALKGQSPKK